MRIQSYVLALLVLCLSFVVGKHHSKGTSISIVLLFSSCNQLWCTAEGINLGGGSVESWSHLKGQNVDFVEKEILKDTPNVKIDKVPEVSKILTQSSEAH